MQKTESGRATALTSTSLVTEGQLLTWRKDIQCKHGFRLRLCCTKVDRYDHESAVVLLHTDWFHQQFADTFLLGKTGGRNQPLSCQLTGL